MNRIDELEGLRGLLAVWVVIVHLLPAAGIDPLLFGIFSPLFGELIRVQIFCIMSGFVLFLMLSKSREGYLTYLRRRFARLYPVYILAFVLSVALAGVAYNAVATPAFESVRNTARLKILQDSFDRWPEHIAAHVTLLHGVIPNSYLVSAPYTFLGQAWNISTEFQFYFIVPALFWLFNNKSIAIRALSIAAVGAAWWLTRHWPNEAALPRYAPYFSCGIASYYIWKSDWSKYSFINIWTLILTFLIVTYFSIALGIWIYIFGSAILVKNGKGKAGFATRALRHPVMIWLGGISYSLYLMHMIPLYIWMNMLNKFQLSQPLYLVLLSTLTLATAVPLALLTFKYVETRFYRSKTHILPEHIVPAHASFASKGDKDRLTGFDA